MKRAYRILVVLTALFLAAEGVVLSMLPDTVPVHYNFAGEVDSRPYMENYPKAGEVLE